MSQIHDKNQILRDKSEKTGYFLILFIFLLGISATGVINYLLFHTLVELFSIIIASVIFIIAWNSRERIQNGFLIIIGCSFLFIGVIDLIHTLTFKGMNILSGFDANLPTQLWIAARYIEALTILVALFFITRKIRFESVFIFYSIITTLIIYLIFAGFFPTCYIEGVGLTSFKIYSEYIICIILVISIAILYREKPRFETDVFWLILGALITTIISELSFTHYISVYGSANYIGHIFKLITFVLIYDAIVVTGISRPYDLIFRELAVSEKKFRNFFETSSDCVFITSPEGRWIDFNNAAVQLFGFSSRDELQLVKIQDLYKNEQDRVKHIQIINEKGFSQDYEVDLRKRDGSIINALISSIPERDENGVISYYQGTIRDITRQKKIEESIRESEARLHSIIEGTPVLQFVIDKDHKVISWNKALEISSNIKASDVIGTNQHWRAFYPDERPCLADILVDDDPDKLTRWFGDTYRKSGFIDGAYELIDFFPNMGPSGKWLYITAAPIQDTSGRLIGSIQTHEDITERKLAEDALKTAFKKLNLLSGITRHDILNELNILMVCQDIVEEGISDLKTTDYFKKGKDATYRILSQIQFTKDYEEIGIKSPKWQNLHQILKKDENIINTGDVIISSNLNNIEIFVDPLFEKVFYNLITNALRHGEKLTKINFFYIESSDGLKIICEDDGVGVPLEEKENIFSRKFFKHTGFGLFLSREILSITGLAITENGEEGKGARFEIFVPHNAYRFISNK